MFRQHIKDAAESDYLLGHLLIELINHLDYRHKRCYHYRVTYHPFSRCKKYKGE